MRHFLILLLCGAPILLSGQDVSFKTDIAGYMGFNQARILDLAKAFPEDKMDWRPSEGIRSVKESLLHVAQVNYMGMMQLGFQPEEEMDYMNLDKMDTDKEKTLEIVQKSFEFVSSHISDIPDGEMNDKVTFPFGEFTKRGTLMLILEHGGEHKGQLIAYARMNGIAPPWSN